MDVVPTRANLNIKRGKMKVFEILQEIRALEDLLNEVDPETGEFINSEEVIKDYIKNLQFEKDKKLNNIEDLKLELKAKNEALKQKEEKLYSKRKSIENNIEKLKELQMILLNGEKVKTDEYTFSFRKSSSIVVPSEIDAAVAPVKIKYEWDKTAIKKEIEQGKDFSKYGIYIEEKQSLSVR